MISLSVHFRERILVVRPSSVIHFTTGRISGAYSTSLVEDFHDYCGTKFAAIIGS